MITVYALLISVIVGFAFLSLSALSTTLLEYWKHVDPGHDPLPSWTTNAPLIARVGLVIPGFLFIAAALSLKLELVSDRFLVHAICLTSIALGIVTVFVIAAGMMPAIVDITEMQEP